MKMSKYPDLTGFENLSGLRSNRFTQISKVFKTLEIWELLPKNVCPGMSHNPPGNRVGEDGNCNTVAVG
jgi:hypothetical protein